MANPDKTARQHVQQETAHKFQGGECHRFLLVAVSRIAPAKGHLAVFEAQNSPVRNRYSMGIVSQIANHVLWSGEGLLGVNHPRLLFQKPSEASKGFPLLQGCEGAGEPQPAS